MSLDKEVAVIQKDIEQVRTVFTKLDTAIERMSEVSANINRMLAVHEEKIRNHDKVSGDLFVQIEAAKVKMSDHTDKVKDEIKKEIKSLDSRVTKLEHWKLLLVGGGIVVGFVLSALINFLR